MSPTLTGDDIALHPALTAAAAALFGINRSEKGRPPGSGPRFRLPWRRGGVFAVESGNTVLTFDVGWHSRLTDTSVPPFLKEFAAEPAPSEISWREAEMA
jgi:hypothetical protein